jgi:hypothetical protein
MPCEPTTTAAASRWVARSTIQPEGTSELSTLLGDDRGVLLPGLVELGHELRTQLDRGDPSYVQTWVDGHHRAQSRLPHRDNQRGAAGEELGSTSHRGCGKIGAVVGNQQPGPRPGRDVAHQPINVGRKDRSRIARIG